MLSIVLAAPRAEGSPAARLQSLYPQLPPEVEVILVGEEPLLLEPAPQVRRCAASGLVPQLWAEGIKRARGRIVAFLGTSVVPGLDWVERTLEAHDHGIVAFGGPVEPSPALGLGDWAIYLCHYSAYMLPLPDGQAEIAGDNASYDADVLRSYSDLYRDGFWEPFVHAAMRRDGHRLVLGSQRIVYQVPRMGVGWFSLQRYKHGRAHGELRARSMHRTEIVLRSVAAPLVPLILLTRVARNVLTCRRYVGRFIATSLLIAWFFACWAAGELVGYSRALRRWPS